MGMKYCITPSTTNTATRASSIRLSEPGSFWGLRYSVNDLRFLSLHSKPLKRFHQNSLSCACSTRLGTLGLATFLINPVARFKLIAALVPANSSVLRQVARLLQTLRYSFLGRDHSPRARKDCNAISAKSLRLIHEKNHTWPRLLLRTPSNWERNGRRPAGEEKWRLYKTADKTWLGSSLSTASLHGGKYLHNLCIQLGKL